VATRRATGSARGASGTCSQPAASPLFTCNRAAGRRYTADGYELVGSPGIAGAVRRSVVYERFGYATDEGARQSCAKACAQFGAG